MATAVRDRDLGLNAYVRKMDALGGRGVKTGIQADAGRDPESGMSLLDIALANEFGTATIPSRPFVRDFFEKNQKVLAQAMERVAAAVASGKVSNVEQALDMLGQFVEKHQKSHVQQSAKWAEPNKPSTVKRKKSSTPLIDHGLMLGAIRYQKTSK